jgi:transposase InsO family protein
MRERALVREIDEARAKIEAWRAEHNESRPHSGLDELTPITDGGEMAARMTVTDSINARVEL